MKECEHEVEGLKPYLTSALTWGEWLTSWSGASARRLAPNEQVTVWTPEELWRNLSRPPRMDPRFFSWFRKIRKKKREFQETRTERWKWCLFCNTHTGLFFLSAILTETWLQIIAYTTLRSQKPPFSLTLSQSWYARWHRPTATARPTKASSRLPYVVCTGYQWMN